MQNSVILNLQMVHNVCKHIKTHTDTYSIVCRTVDTKVAVHTCVCPVCGWTVKVPSPGK